VPLELDPRFTQRVFVQARQGSPPLRYDNVIADPFTGDVRKRLRYGDLSDGLINLLPLLETVHYSLGAARWGALAFGIAALIWSINSAIGFWLTLPRFSSHASTAISGTHRYVVWFREWLPAWTIRRQVRSCMQARTRIHMFNYDPHRASGLWLWSMLLVFAWSAVGFNLPQVHDPLAQ
jgi:uncharacterized iron-regulated membrane protein